jgi:hypothetical protein
MRGWLKLFLKVIEIAMESTGRYWRPTWNVREGPGFERLLLANPVQVKALADARATDATASVSPSSCRTTDRMRARCHRARFVSYVICCVIKHAQDVLLIRKRYTVFETRDDEAHCAEFCIDTGYPPPSGSWTKNWSLPYPLLRLNHR